MAAPRLKWFSLIVDGVHNAKVREATRDASGAYAVRVKRSGSVVYVGVSAQGVMWKTITRHFHAAETFKAPKPKGGGNSFAVSSPEGYEVAYRVTSRGRRPVEKRDEKAIALEGRWISEFFGAGEPLKNDEIPVGADDDFAFGANVRSNPGSAFDEGMSYETAGRAALRRPGQRSQDQAFDLLRKALAAYEREEYETRGRDSGLRDVASYQERDRDRRRVRALLGEYGQGEPRAEGSALARLDASRSSGTEERVGQWSVGEDVTVSRGARGGSDRMTIRRFIHVPSIGWRAYVSNRGGYEERIVTVDDLRRAPPLKEEGKRKAPVRKVKPGVWTKKDIATLQQQISSWWLFNRDGKGATSERIHAAIDANRLAIVRGGLDGMAAMFEARSEDNRKAAVHFDQTLPTDTAEKRAHRAVMLERFWDLREGDGAAAREAKALSYRVRDEGLPPEVVTFDPLEPNKPREPATVDRSAEAAFLPAPVVGPELSDREVLRLVEGGFAHSAPVASMPAEALPALKRLVSGGRLQRMPARGSFPDRYVVTATGSHELGTFDHDDSSFRHDSRTINDNAKRARLEREGVALQKRLREAAAKPTGYGTVETRGKRAGQVRMFNPGLVPPVGKLTELGVLTRLSTGRDDYEWSLRDAPVLAYDTKGRLFVVYVGKVARASTPEELREYARTHWGAKGRGDCSNGALPTAPLETLGRGTSIQYSTRKGSDRSITDYVHEWGEGGPRTFEAPRVVVHECGKPRCAWNGAMALVGGSYVVNDRGIVG